MTIPSPISAFNYSSPSPADTNVQEFTSSGQWVKPPGCNVVIVEAWGAGSGGNAGSKASSPAVQGGQGGGGGAYVTRTFKASDLPSTVVVTVGAGGIGGATQTVNNNPGNAGTSGGNSSFGSFLVGYGGTTPNGLNGGAGVLGIDVGFGGPPTSRISSLSQGIIAGSFGGSAFGSNPTVVVGSGWAGGSGGVTSSTLTSRIAGGSSFQGGAGGGAGLPAFNANTPSLSYLTSFTVNGGGVSGDAGTGGVVGTPTSPNGSNGVNPREGGGGGSSRYANTNDGMGYMATGGGRALGLSVTGGNGPSVWVVTGTSLSAGGLTFEPCDLNQNFVSSPSSFVGQLIYDGTSWILANRGGGTGFTGTSYIFSSTNRTNWTLQYTEAAIVANCIAHDAGTYVIVGNAGSIKTSTNLTSWTTRTSGTAQNLNYVIHDGTRWIAVGNAGVTLTSTDAITWTLVTIGTSGNLTAVASSGTNIVATAANTPFAWRSTDGGATWNSVTTTLTTSANGQINFVNSNFIIAAASNVWTSSDGNTWTQRTDGQTDSYGRIAFLGGSYFIGSITAGTVRFGIRSGDLNIWFSFAITVYTQNSGNGGNGVFPGGGGGGGGGAVGAANGGAGGNGGNGLVRVYSF